MKPHIKQIIPKWVKRISQRRLFQEALIRTYTTWAPHHWEWVDYSFNKHFVMNRAAPLLAGYLKDGLRPDPAELANAWAKQFTWFDEEMRQRHLAKLVPVATYFLRCLEAELLAQPEYRPSFDSHIRKVTSEVTVSPIETLTV